MSATGYLPQLAGSCLKENQDRISQIRSKMEEELQQELRQQSEDAKATMKRLEATYENRHEEYAQALFKNMIKE